MKQGIPPRWGPSAAPRPQPAARSIWGLTGLTRLRLAFFLEFPGFGEGTQCWHHQDDILAALVDLFPEQETLEDRMLRTVPVFRHRRGRLGSLDVIATQEQEHVNRFADAVL